MWKRIKAEISEASYANVPGAVRGITNSWVLFENCYFTSVDFIYCDLRVQCLDGLTFIGVKFGDAALNEVTFKGATLRNVSFRPAFALTNRNYLAFKTINFDGAMMDKLTYAALKGLGVDLSKVIVI